MLPAAPGVSLAFKSTGRRTGEDGSYWITYPDGSEVQVYGAHGACVLSQEAVFAEFQRAHAHDQSVISGLNMQSATGGEQPLGQLKS